jgi:leucyl-tRNA synthetase
MAEELWQRLGNETSLAYEPWPTVEEKWLVDESIKLAVQVNGKVRSTISVPADASKEAIIEAAKADEKVDRHVEGKEIRREIYVPGRLVNIVVG